LLLILKWLINCVFPAYQSFCEVLWLVSMLISDDFPTLERPMKAYSGNHLLWAFVYL
jgi:hypothetical protein